MKKMVDEHVGRGNCTRRGAYLYGSTAIQDANFHLLLHSFEIVAFLKCQAMVRHVLWLFRNRGVAIRIDKRLGYLTLTDALLRSP